LRARIPQGLFLLILTASFTANAQNTQKPETRCLATLTIEGPSAVAEGKQITFDVSLGGRVVGQKITYLWTVQPEVTTTGHGTSSLVTETAGYGGQDIIVSVSVGGIDGCPTLVAWHTTYVTPPEPTRIGQYTEHTLELRQPLRQIAERELSKSLEANIFMIAHERQTVARHHKPAHSINAGDAMRMAQEDKDYLVHAGIKADRIKILPGAPEAELTVEFYLVPKGATPPLANVAAGTPPGTRVDVMWTLLPQNIAGDIFGSNVKRKYYCIQVTILNNSGYEFQVGGFGFTVPGLARSNASQTLTPSTGYPIVRHTINQGQRSGLRNTSLALIKGMGLVMTGVTPFFRSASHQGNFSKLLNIMSNPVEVGFEMFFPDQTLQYLEQLDNTGFRDTANVRLSIPTNRSISTMVFLPKDLINLPKPKRDNPPEVLSALGNLFVFGDTVQHVRSIRVTGRP
jgi:hypothetical protein